MKRFILLLCLASLPVYAQAAAPSATLTPPCASTAAGTFDPTVPHNTIDGCDIALTPSQVTAYNAAQTTAASQQAVTQMQLQASKLLAASDKTMLRIQEAVTLGNTTWTTPDVVAWVTWRRALRVLVTATTLSPIPAQPPFPAGT